MIARILCRLGWHSWKPIYRPSIWKFDWIQFESPISSFVDCWLEWKKSGRTCRRCGKRVIV